MTDLLLTHGYFLAEDEKERQIMKPYPPLGLLYLSAYLKAHGRDVDVYDSTFGDRQELLQRLDASRPAVVGIYTNLMTRRPVLEIMQAARERGWTVVLGGPEAANYPAEYLDAGADGHRPRRGRSDVARAACPHCRQRAAGISPRSAESSSGTTAVSWCGRRGAPGCRTSTPCPFRIAKRSITSSTWTSGGATTGRAASI